MNIKFRCLENNIEAIPHPTPAAKNIPEWYKRMSLQRLPDEPKLFIKEGKFFGTNNSVKECIPIRDTITSGYIIPLWCDLAVSYNKKDDIISCSWSAAPDTMQIDSHPLNQVIGSPIEKMAIQGNVWKLVNPWHIETPAGYSCLINAPFYHDDIPIKILPGIVDTDKWANINFPLDLDIDKNFDKDFQLIIPRGTPLAQVTPFKRVDWKMRVDVIHESEMEKKQHKASTKILNSYRYLFHSLKKYR